MCSGTVQKAIHEMQWDHIYFLFAICPSLSILLVSAANQVIDMYNFLCENRLSMEEKMFQIGKSVWLDWWKKQSCSCHHHIWLFFPILFFPLLMCSVSWLLVNLFVLNLVCKSFTLKWMLILRAKPKMFDLKKLPWNSWQLMTCSTSCCSFCILLQLSSSKN